jgi:hypothetical protein
MVFNKAKNLADTLYWELFTIELYILFLLSWPENKEVVILLEKPLNTGEATTVQKVYLSQEIYKEKEKKRALKLLNGVANMTPDRKDPISDLEQIEKA